MVLFRALMQNKNLNSELMPTHAQRLRADLNISLIINNKILITYIQTYFFKPSPRLYVRFAKKNSKLKYSVN